LGLREVVRRLTTVSLAGIVLTREGLRDMALRLGVPIGAGDRGQMLSQLFVSAAELERVPTLVALLRSELERWDARYAAWSEQHPASAAIWADWRQSVEATRTMLLEMSVQMER
jgi:hypothetical protein